MLVHEKFTTKTLFNQKFVYFGADIAQSLQLLFKQHKLKETRNTRIDSKFFL